MINDDNIDGCNGDNDDDDDDGDSYMRSVGIALDVKCGR